MLNVMANMWVFIWLSNCEGLKRVFHLGELLVIEQARDAGTKTAFCQMQLVLVGCLEILHPRCDQIDWRIVLSMSGSL
jgi:hypothetical protein